MFVGVPCPTDAVRRGVSFPAQNLEGSVQLPFFVMAYHVYILYSPSIDSYYNGKTSDLNDGLKRHNI
jgi:hypothetical protein